jgi:hypothetical protein
MDSRKAEPMTFKEFQSEGGKEMVRINLLPEGPGAEIWRKLEKVVWISWFLLPFAILLWAKLALDSK